MSVKLNVHMRLCNDILFEIMVSIRTLYHQTLLNVYDQWYRNRT